MFGGSQIGSAIKVNKLETIIFKLKTEKKLDEKEKVKVKEIVEKFESKK